MTASILSELLEGINQQIQEHETVEIHLHQADALVRIGSLTDFDQISNEALHHYFTLLMDIFEKITQLNEHLTEKLYQWAMQLKQNVP